MHWNTLGPNLVISEFQIGNLRTFCAICSLSIFYKTGTDKIFPLRFNMELIARLQSEIAPEIFTPRAVYDGRKNLFARRVLPLGPTDSKEVGGAFSHISSSSFETLHSSHSLLSVRTPGLSRFG